MFVGGALQLFTVSICSDVAQCLNIAENFGESFFFSNGVVKFWGKFFSNGVVKFWGKFFFFKRC